MRNIDCGNYEKELKKLCKGTEKFLKAHDFDDAEALIISAMSRFPDAAQPHNLYGILLETKGSHTDAMRHFRAAIALDPEYKPADDNLNYFGQAFGCRRRNKFGNIGA